AEGTILTVSRLTANAALKGARKAGSIEAVLESALAQGRIALEQTTEQNPVLKKAGVVDAGGKGYLIILEAMLDCLNGTFTLPAVSEHREEADFTAIEDEEIRFTYCTEFIVSRDEPRSPLLLRSYLQTIGDSLVFVEDDDIIKVHVHTDEPGNVITEALRYGALQTVKIENMRNQHTELANGAAETEEVRAPFAPSEKPVGFVAVCAGDGLKELFLTLGTDRVVTGGQTMNPSTEDILREVNLTPADTVFVLPNNKNIIMAAQQVIPLTEKKVVVIPTTTVPQGIAAMAYRDEEADAETLSATLMETAEPVRTLLVTYAARDSEFDGYSIHSGEYLALLDGALLGSFDSFEALSAEIRSTLAGLAPAVVTIYAGEDAREEECEELELSLAAALPDTDVSALSGGQPVYYYMIAVE
ncbi:MAG: DAK2 domain-containing protein, partial [Clostridiales bacterium]|nr:DAK2 domain-containing protein [Candidatus Apopatocola equi]